jgi:hypothetical protein
VEEGTEESGRREQTEQAEKGKEESGGREQTEQAEEETENSAGRESAVYPARDSADKKEDLTARARALYEDSVVTVAEIARLCGVTERTIYKYVQRGNWKPRYRWIAGEAGARHRRWHAPPAFAPATGAGARFIRRADKQESPGEPFAVGLKATDPAAAVRAAAACRAASAVAERAAAQAALARHREAEIDAIAAVAAAVAEIVKDERRRAKQESAADSRRGGMRDRRRSDHDALARALWVAAALAVSRWEAMLGF